VGTYSVTLISTNAGGGDTEVKTDYISVTPILYTFSTTNSMYLNKEPTAASLDAINAVIGRLRNVANWQDPVFSVKGPAVTPGYFGGISQEPTSYSLNDATLHFHVGHGSPPDNTGSTDIILLKTTESNEDGQYDGYSFKASDIQNKWGGKNKWVILASCYTLKDKKWGQKMGTTHGIFGFSTVSNNKAALYNEFLSNAISGKTLYDSWFLATTLELKNDDVSSYYTADGKPAKDPKYIDAVVFFKTQEQMKRDHLPDGDIAEDGDPNNIDFFYDAWNVHTREKVTL
jgi:PKD repeat protein